MRLRASTGFLVVSVRVVEWVAARKICFHADDGRFSLFLPRLGRFEALLSPLCLCVLTLVALQIERPWAL